jgi:hypothetical protein
MEEYWGVGFLDGKGIRPLFLFRGIRNSSLPLDVVRFF